jgi:hypothetical protein
MSQNPLWAKPGSAWVVGGEKNNFGQRNFVGHEPRDRRYFAFSIIPSIIAFICGCRSFIICIITGIERCITSGIF